MQNCNRPAGREREILSYWYEYSGSPAGEVFWQPPEDGVHMIARRPFPSIHPSSMTIDPSIALLELLGCTVHCLFPATNKGRRNLERRRSKSEFNFGFPRRRQHCAHPSAPAEMQRRDQSLYIRYVSASCIWSLLDRFLKSWHVCAGYLLYTSIPMHAQPPQGNGRTKFEQKFRRISRSIT